MRLMERTRKIRVLPCESLSQTVCGLPDFSCISPRHVDCFAGFSSAVVSLSHRASHDSSTSAETCT